LSKLVKRLRRYSNFSISKECFNMVAVCHHGFSNSGNFNGQLGAEIPAASFCQSLSKLVKWLQRYSNFFIFQDGGCAVLNFEILEILTVDRLRRSRCIIKPNYFQNRSNVCRDMAIFPHFFKMEPFCHLQFVRIIWNRSLRPVK